MRKPPRATRSKQRRAFLKWPGSIDKLARAPGLRAGARPASGVVAAQLTAMTSVLWLFVLARLLQGLSTGSSVPSTLGYISEATVGRPSLRARVMGMFEITLVGGIALGAVIGGYLWKFFSSPLSVAGITLESPAF